MRLIIIGAGGYGRVVADIAAQNGEYNEIGFLDDNCNDACVLGKCAGFPSFADEHTEFYVAFGNNELRMKFINSLIDIGAKIATIIHKTAYISPLAKIDVGTAVLPNSVVNTNVVLNKGVIINCGAVVDHDCIIGEGTHICINTVIKAENNIPALTKVDAGVVIENRQYPIK